MTRLTATIRACALLLLLHLLSTHNAAAQVCAQATGNANLTGQSNVTLIIDPTMPARISSSVIAAQANTWKNTCTGNTEGIPTFTTASGSGFGPGQTFNNSIYVKWNPGFGSPDSKTHLVPIASYDPSVGILTIYGASGPGAGAAYDWSQAWILQSIAHEIGHALGLDHDNCSPNSMMQASVNPKQILQIQPGECLLANYMSCDPEDDPKCPTQDPRKPPLGNWNHGGIFDVCTRMPSLCPNGGGAWLIVYDCIATTVTHSDCFQPYPCPSVERRESLLSPHTVSTGGNLWSKDDVMCYPDFIIPQPYADPTPLTNGALGPNISVLAPFEGQTVSGVVTVTGAALQPITGAGQVALWLDNVALPLTGFAQSVAIPGACQDPTNAGTDPYCPNVGFSGSFDTRTVANGPHTLQVIALDRRTSFPSASYYERHFTTSNSCFDTTPPTVSIQSPTSGSVVSGVATVTVAASDNASLGQVSLYVDGVVVQTWTAAPFRYSWNTSGLSSGVYSLQARALDSCSNSAASSTIQVNVTTSNTIHMYIDAPAANASISGSAVTLEGWATDAAGIASVGFAADGVPLTVNSSSYGVSRADVCQVFVGDPHCPNVGWIASFNSNLLANGSHLLSVTATDSGGQQMTANVNVVVADAATSTMVWAQPQSLAGYGPAGSLIVAGTVTPSPGPPSLGVALWWRDVTAGGSWQLAPYQAVPENGTWLNDIPSVNYAHQYAFYAVYDAATSATCTCPGTDTLFWCP